MRIIVISDLHGSSAWKRILSEEEFDRVVFLGDYFDSDDESMSAIMQMDNFREIVRFKEEQNGVEMLIGNHDHHYFQEVGDTGTSGYQRGAAPAISQLLEENRHHLQMAAYEGDVLFSHAGVSKTWLLRNRYEGVYNAKDICEFVNELWHYRSKYPFMFNGIEKHGDDTCQTPIWIRPKSLIADWLSTDNKLVQVVGHTQKEQILNVGNNYFFVDTLNTSGEYLVYENGKFSSSKNL